MNSNTTPQQITLPENKKSKTSTIIFIILGLLTLCCIGCSIFSYFAFKDVFKYIDKFSNPEFEKCLRSKPSKSNDKLTLNIPGLSDGPINTYTGALEECAKDLSTTTTQKSEELKKMTYDDSYVMYNDVQNKFNLYYKKSNWTKSVLDTTDDIKFAIEDSSGNSFNIVSIPSPKGSSTKDWDNVFKETLLKEYKNSLSIEEKDVKFDKLIVNGKTFLTTEFIQKVLGVNVFTKQYININNDKFYILTSGIIDNNDTTKKEELLNIIKSFEN